MQNIIFGITATIIWGCVHLYVGHRLINGSLLKRPWNLVGWSVVAAHASLTPLAFLFARSLEKGPFLDLLQWTTYVGMGFLILLLTLVIVRDVFFLAAKWTRLFEPKDPFPNDPTRRTLLTSGLNLGIFAASGVATRVGYGEARRAPTIEEVKLKIAGLPPDLEGFRIVQVSDMHVGPTLRRPFVTSVVDAINALDPDIVAVTGDLIDGWVSDLHPELEPMRSIRSRHGVYYCTGNHEWYWDPDSWKAEAQNLGMRTLANEHALIEVGAARLLIGGVDDYSSPRNGGITDPALAIEGAPDHDYSVLLAHQPKSCYAAAKAGWKLQLSGHTHGGQFYPWNFFVGLAHPFNAGHGVWEGMDVYVSRGTGYWGPPSAWACPRK